MNTQAPITVIPIDACTGPEMARRALDSGVNKSRLGFGPTLILGILAGAYIAFGSNFFTIVMTGSGELGFGLSRLLGALVFCLGLILVVVGGAELFTGNNLIIMAWLSGRVSSGRLLRNWGIVYLGNLVGALGIACLVYLAYQQGMNDFGVGAKAVDIAVSKVTLPWGAALARGILCNALVCMAIWMCYSARTTTDRILTIIFPITAFVACGFEHSVANMYLIPAGILAALDPQVLAAYGGSAHELTWQAFVVANLIPVTLGNIIGGAVMVGAVYWVAYLLPEHRREQRERRERECQQ